MPESADISVTIPVDSRFVALARVTAASLAAELDFTIDEIEELRVGANELVSLLIEWAEDNAGEEIELRYHLSADRLDIAGEVQPRASEVEPEPTDPLTRQILGAVVDEYEIAGGQGRIAKSRMRR